VVVGARRGEPAGLVEDGAVLLKEAVQHGQRRVGGDYGRGRALLVGRRCRATHALPSDAPTVAPERHGEGGAVPQDGSQRPKEVETEDEVEPAEVQTNARNDEVLVSDADGDGASDPRAG